MALVEISNFPGTPKLRCRVPNGTLFYDWLAANDANFHRDLLILRNGVKLSDDDELALEPLHDVQQTLDGAQDLFRQRGRVNPA